MSGDEHRPVETREERLALLQQSFADALVRGDEAQASDTMSLAIESSFAEAEIDEHIVTPAMRFIGDLWAQGEIGIADEHLATEISLRVLTLQREAFRVARRRAGHRVLFAAVAGEQHIVGLRMAASLALHCGFDVRMLGADVPLEALLAAIARHEPGVVGLTATMPASAARVLEAFDAISAAAPGVPVVAGGAAIDRRFELHSCINICRHVSDLPGQLEALVQRAAIN